MSPDIVSILEELLFFLTLVCCSPSAETKALHTKGGYVALTSPKSWVEPTSLLFCKPYPYSQLNHVKSINL